MRCRNCHLQLIPTDTHCPSCRSSVARATAAAPGEMADKPNGLLKMLPVFGGAAGGVFYGAIQSSSASARPSTPRPFVGASTTAGPGGSGAPSVSKLLIGLVLLLGGGLFLFIAGREVWSTWSVSRRQATDVTAAELCRADFVGSAPDWIRYTFTESKPTAVAVKRKRVSGGGDADVRCLLVRVEDKWLLATVPPGFQGGDLVGSIVRFDPTASRPMIEQVVKAEPKVTALLPFEFNGVEGSAGDQRLRYTAAAILGFVGLVGVLIGLCLIPFGGRSAAQPAVN
jgi:hypothetical protein